MVTQIKTDITGALKSGDKVRLETLRMLLSDIRYLAVDKYGAQGELKITDADVLEVVKKQVKKHEESVTAFSSAGRGELAAKEQGELDILKVFLPPELSDQELESIVGKVILENPQTNFGQLMGLSMKEVAGRAGGNRVAETLRKMLPQK